MPSRELGAATLEFHVAGHLWKASCCFHPKGSGAARQWVDEKLLAILQGKASDVAAGIRRSVALRYEEVFGGSGLDEAESPLVFAENPVGAGFLTRPRDGAPLPRLEHPDHRVTAVEDRPPPATLGFVPCGWKQRARRAPSTRTGRARADRSFRSTSRSASLVAGISLLAYTELALGVSRTERALEE